MRSWNTGLLPNINSRGVTVDIHRAREIVEMLIDGVDPFTGEIMPPEHLNNVPDVNKALQIVLSSIRVPTKSKKMTIEEMQQMNLEGGKPKNAGLPWEADQRIEVAEMYKTEGL